MKNILLQIVTGLFIVIILGSCNEEDLITSESDIQTNRIENSTTKSSPQGRSFLGIMDCVGITNLGATAYTVKEFSTFCPIGPYDDTPNGTGAQLAEIQLRLNGRQIPNTTNPLYLFGQFKVELISSPNVKLVGAYLYGDAGVTYYPIYNYQSYSGKTQQIILAPNIATVGFNGRINIVVSTTNMYNTPITLRFTGYENVSDPSSTPSTATSFNGSTTLPLDVLSEISGFSIQKTVFNLDGTTTADTQYSISNGPWMDFISSIFVITNSPVRYRATFNNTMYPGERAKYEIIKLPNYSISATYYDYTPLITLTSSPIITIGEYSAYFRGQVGRD